MRLLLAFSSMILISGCGVVSVTKSDDSGSPDVGALVKNNDPSACAAVSAIALALRSADRRYGPYADSGAEPVKVDTITANAIKPDIHEISCDATLHYRSMWKTGEQSLPFSYVLRPALDKDASFVAATSGGSELQDAIGSHIQWGEAKKQGGKSEPIQNEQNAGVADNSSAPITDEVAAGETGGSCEAKILLDVAAIESPDSTMKAGTSWSNVTQFWRNSKTGDTWFCAHGDYCYPDHVAVNGVREKSIELTNCHVGTDGEANGDETLYSVEN